MKHLSILVILTLLAACSGGGGGGIIPSPGSSVVPQTKSVQVLIKIPSAATSSSNARRRPDYISPGTQSISIQLAMTTVGYPFPPPGTVFTPYGTPTIANLTPTSPNCTAISGGTQCIVTMFYPYFPSTTYQLTGTMYAALNATGLVLSTTVPNYFGGGMHQGAIGSANVIPLQLDGVVDHWVVSVAAPFVVGVPSSQTLSVIAYDAAGYAITPSPGDFVGGVASLTDPWADPAQTGEESLAISTGSNSSASLSFALPPGANTTCVGFGFLVGTYSFALQGPQCSAVINYTSGSDTITAQATDTDYRSSHPLMLISATYTINPFNPGAVLSVTIPAPIAP